MKKVYKVTIFCIIVMLVSSIMAYAGTVTGTVTLPNFSRSTLEITGTVTITDGTNTESHNIILDGSGNYSFTTSLSGYCAVVIKCSHWLAQTIYGANVISGSINIGTVSLMKNGDVVDNNEVDFDDINAVRAAYGSFPGDDTWNEQADVDGSGEVDFTDINIVRSNYGEIGDIIGALSPCEMIYIPAGSFLMGNSGVGYDVYFPDPVERPQHSVTLSGYWIGKYEVTRGEYKQFMNAGGYSNSSYWSSDGWSWKGSRTVPNYWAETQDWEDFCGVCSYVFTQTDNHPVIGITYYESEAFCNWAGGHLPTEAQWERAARWDVSTSHPNVYPWGDTWNQEYCNNSSDSNSAGGGYWKYQTAPVGSYSSYGSPSGCQDMAGNVWEWCQDWLKSYPGSSSPFDYTNSHRVLRGGAWFDSRDSNIRCAYRYDAGPGYYNPYFGFRLVCNDASNPISVTGVILNKTTLTLIINAFETLVATVIPGNATNKALTWSSSNTDVVTVDGNGLVTAVNPGSSTITVTTVDGGFTATCIVTVNTGEMIYIPAGSFLMGNSGIGNDAIYGYSDEFPQHSVTLAAYSIGKYEVTRGEYRLFINAGGYSNSSYWSTDGWSWKGSRTEPDLWAASQNWDTGTFTQTDNHPVVGVSYYEAEAFCNWVGGYLPTEAQWERAARWNVSTSHPNVYPWGDTWNQEYCNNYYDSNPVGGGYQKRQTTPVGSYSSYPGPSGCQDMAGNVWEWCQDWYKSYPGSSSPFDYKNSSRVVRGGGWDSYYDNPFRCAHRNYTNPYYFFYNLGFRIARNDASNPISVTGVTLNKTTLTLIINAFETLVATVIPGNATNKALTWSSSNTDVAIVDGNGLVNAANPGSSTITVTTVDGGFTATCIVTVNTGEMIYIPAGSFMMGNSGIGDDATYSNLNELPQHSVTLSSYSIGKYEVTRGEYRLFINAGGYSNSSYWSIDGWSWKVSNNRIEPGCWAESQDWASLWGQSPQPFTQTENHPVVGVTYYEAEAFCNWAGGHLPTEAQWERAARWNVSTSHPNVYPWGDTWNDEYCNNYMDSNSAGGGYQKYQTAPVGSYSSYPSPSVCQDMAGNVWEWCQDWYKSYPGSSSPFDETNSLRVLRGGAWDYGSKYRCASRYGDSPNIYHGGIGFRLVRNDASNPISVTGVTLNKTTLTLIINAFETLVATVIPGNATNKALTWSSSNTDVAIVDGNGLVTAANPGSSTITVTTVDGGFTATCIVTVDTGEMIYIPAGDFLMGNSGIGNDAYYGSPDEFPQHSVALSSYWISKYEVIRGLYRQFMNAGGYSNSSYWSTAGWSWKVSNSRTEPHYWAANQDWGSGTFTQTDNHPVVGVNYYEAEAFCNWADGHLPTEAQWERAARWNVSTSHPNVYPWGDTWNQEYCNNYYDSNPAGGGYEKRQTAPVGSYSNYGSPSGCQDMSGNVWEWCQDWVKSYPGSYSPFDYTNSYRVLRGGDWFSYYEDCYLRCADRSGDNPNNSDIYNGFRLVRNSETNPIAVTSVTLNKTTLTLIINAFETLVATVIPSNATNKALTWSSSNTTIATVDGNGLVTAVNPGSSTITVTTVEGGFTATCIVTVDTGEMIYIPAGSFLMGNSGIGNDASYGYSGEFPQHSVSLLGYYIGKYEVTRGEYKQFMNAGGYSNSSYWSTDGWSWKVSNSRTEPYYWAASQNWSTGTFIQTDNHPVIGITYYESEAFCNWAGGHLPTEAQWEQASRWNVSTSHPNIYPWGDTWNQEYCNNWDDSNTAGGGYAKYQTAPVSSYSSYGSPSGCQDMAGNVWEWCQDWCKSYPGSSSPFDYTNSYRVLRGGGWNYYSGSSFRCAYRSGDSPNIYHGGIGFRIARNDASNPISVTGVTLNKTTLTLNINAFETLVATVIPGNATNKALTWSSSDNAIATVDGNGLVTAANPGSSTITVTTVDGGFTATCIVTVNTGEMIYIPAGDFLMGNSGIGDDATYSNSSELPQHSVTLSGYYIGKYEVTRGEYRQFMNAGGYTNWLFKEYEDLKRQGKLPSDATKELIRRYPDIDPKKLKKRLIPHKKHKGDVPSRKKKDEKTPKKFIIKPFPFPFFWPVIEIPKFTIPSWLYAIPEGACDTIPIFIIIPPGGWTNPGYNPTDPTTGYGGT